MLIALMLTMYVPSRTLSVKLTDLFMKKFFTFIETTVFTKQKQGLLTQQELEKIQNELLDNPDIGRVIEGGNGIRKLRVKRQGMGKSGGSRLIYFNRLDCGKIYLMFIYPKNEQEDLTPAQKKLLSEATKGL